MYEPLGFLGGQGAEVLHRRMGADDQGQRRRIRSDHQVARQAALQPQARHAERLILVVEVGVQGVEARFRDAPRHPVLPAVLDLSVHGGAPAFLKQGAGVGAQQQPRHEVLEHGPAPGDQSDTAGGARQLPAELEPVPPGHVATGDGQEAGQ
jgi:hypothetical protein